MEIEISSDGMHAYLIPGPCPQGQTAEIAIREIHDQLKASSVVRGIDEAAIRSLAEDLVAGNACAEKVEVATGKRPEDGINGRVGFQFMVDGQPPTFAPATGKTRSMPPSARNKDLVRSGAILATVAPARPGVDGYTVLGVAVKAKPSTDVQLKTGPGVRKLEDGITYVVAPDTVGYANCVNGTVTVEIPVTVAPDGTEARLKLYPIPPGGGAPTWGDVERWLAQQGVVHGLRAEALAEALVRARAPNASVQEIVVAKATPPENGTDASVEICFHKDPLIGGAAGRDDRIDYHERDFLHRVRQGDLLARKTPATRGVAGSDVRGKPTPATDGRDMKLEITGDAVLSEDGLECHAGKDGIAIVVGASKVGVFEEYTIPGDVDLKTGNLHMNGVLTIQGWVRSGFKVSATGDVGIAGGIESSVVEVEANLAVQGGIVGAHQGLVRCQGSLSAQFIENAHVETGGDVTVRDSILNSHVNADGQVTAREGKGCIVGGKIRAAKGIEVNEAGSRAAVRTVLDVDFDTETRRRLADMARDCALYERNQQKIGKTLATLAHQGRTRQLGQTETQAQAKLIRYRRDIEQKRRTIAEYWKRLDDTFARIKVGKAVYDGTTVFVYGRRMDIAHDLSAPGEFALDSGSGQVIYLPGTTNT